MSGKKSIHTIEARGNVMLEVIREHFSLGPERMFREIQALRDQTEKALSTKGIDYSALRSALVPDQAKKEASFVFDTTKIKSGWYGREVFSRVIPLLEPKSNQSILTGDYLDSTDQETLYRAFASALIPAKQINYQHSTQFFIVYLTRLSAATIGKIDESLKAYPAYAGYADTTYTSPFKIFISTMLPHLCVKHGRIIIQGHEDDRPNTEDVNMCGYPFEEHNYICRSIQSSLQGVLLSYKIERPVFPGFETDTEFAINALGASVHDLEKFEVIVEEAKLGYLRKQKSGSLERARISAISSEALAALIKEKVAENYIYNLVLDEEHGVTKFNIILEIPAEDDAAACRLLAALELRPEERRLRLLTLF